MEDLELIERYFRKELNADESSRFNERLAADPAFKSKFETESLVHKALQFSHERENIKAHAMSYAAVTSAKSTESVVTLGVAALAVWIFSTFSASITSLPPENIKWVGLGVAVAGSIFLLGLRNKTMNFRLVTTGLFNGLLVFVLASGIDAINQGAEGIAGKEATEALIVPYTGNSPWWPTQSLEDSLEVNRKKLREMGDQIRTLVASRLNAGPNLNFGFVPGKFTPVVIARSSTVSSGSTYEADMFLATSPLRQTIEMRVDGRPIPLEADPSGVQRGRVSFTASANEFDPAGTARKKFVAEIKVGDSTYTKVVEYWVLKPR